MVLIIGLFDTAWHVIGIQDLLMSMAFNKKFTDRILDLSTDYIIGGVDQVPNSVEGIRFLEDWAGQYGLLMSPNHWRKFLKPRLKKIYGAAKNKGCVVMTHSDGDITELYPDLIELGNDISYPTQPEVMDIEYIKKEFGKDILIWWVRLPEDNSVRES